MTVLREVAGEDKRGGNVFLCLHHLAFGDKLLLVVFR